MRSGSGSTGSLSRLRTTGPPTWLATRPEIRTDGPGDPRVAAVGGSYGGGHGHPDRLNLVLHADGEYWLPDFGTGSYVARDLFWYRSTLAHNAPRLDGASQPPRPGQPPRLRL